MKHNKTSLLLHLYLISLGTSSLVISGFRSLNALVGLLLILSVFFHLKNDESQRKTFNTKAILLAVAILGWCAISMIWSPSKSDAFAEFQKATLCIFTSFAIAVRAGSLSRRYIQSFILGALIVSALTIQSTFGASLDLLNSVQYNSRWNALGLDFNDEAIYLVIAVTFCWILLLIPGISKLEFFFVLAALVVLSLGVLATGSRTGLAGIFLSLSISVLYIGRVHLARRNQSRRFRVIVLIAVVILVFESLSTSQYSRFATRSLSLLGTLINNRTLTGRTIIWHQVISSWSTWILGGVGIGGSKSTINSYLGDIRVTHNSFLSIAYELGIVGIILFVSFLIVVVRYCRTLESKIFLFPAFLTLLVLTQTVSWQWNRSVWALFGFALIGTVNRERLLE